MVMEIKNNQTKINSSVIGITGSSGFVGSNLCEYLSLKKIHFVIFKGDLLNKDDVNNFFIKNTVTQVIHLAGTFKPPFCNLLEKNVLTTQSILDIGIKYGLKKIVYVSSGAVYGEPLQNESYETDPLQPNTLYGLSKQYAEECIHFYASNSNLTYVILRLPNIYGEENTKGVIFNFLNDIKHYKKITILGDGTQRRDFIHVSDVTLALVKALKYNHSDIFNISNPTRTSLLELVQLLRKKYVFSIEYAKADNNLHDLILNTDKATKKLNFQPKLKSLQI